MVHQFRGTFFPPSLDRRHSVSAAIQRSPVPRGRPSGIPTSQRRNQAMWLVRVELPWACFGFEVTDDGWVIEAAPIAAWTIGRRGRQVVAHYRQRGGLVSWPRVSHRRSYAGRPIVGQPGCWLVLHPTHVTGAAEPGAFTSCPCAQEEGHLRCRTGLVESSRGSASRSPGLGVSFGRERACTSTRSPAEATGVSSPSGSCQHPASPTFAAAPRR
jgi:hypothetical protein